MSSGDDVKRANRAYREERSGAIRQRYGIREAQDINQAARDVALIMRYIKYAPLWGSTASFDELYLAACEALSIDRAHIYVDEKTFGTDFKWFSKKRLNDDVAVLFNMPCAPPCILKAVENKDTAMMSVVETLVSHGWDMTSKSLQYMVQSHPSLFYELVARHPDRLAAYKKLLIEASKGGTMLMAKIPSSEAEAAQMSAALMAELSDSDDE